MVLKTKLDQPVGLVQSPINGISGMVPYIESFSQWTNHEPPKPMVGLVNQMNRMVLDEDLFIFYFFIL